MYHVFLSSSIVHLYTPAVILKPDVYGINNISQIKFLKIKNQIKTIKNR